MYITNMTHSLNEQGEIVKEMPESGKERRILHKIKQVE
jgi:hypothetical protein